jgi:Heterokaryon incompatibility protein (HET)
MMNIIYGLASTITIWLGLVSHNSTLAMQWLAYLGTESPYAKLPILDRDVLDAFQSLLSRSWWFRVWIIQEVAIGGLANKIHRLTMKCGNKSIL